MKLDSKYFDSIRVKQTATEQAAPDGPRCQWKGCGNAGAHRAPMGRGREGQYFVFCIEHVRQYNSTYNYFDGMNDDEIAAFQKDAVIGHRPTWQMGAGNATGPVSDTARRFAAWQAQKNAQDAFGFFGGKQQAEAKPEPSRTRPLRTLERKALDTLHLDAGATKVEVKARFKELVKQHHPDLNGGDRSCEDKLREIIQAYNYLRQAGLV
ncbi:MAG: DnaJ domain-containing protein [Hyphomicrobiaceae bacterium]|nr:DnaJ domain-containing protein [Hyphomicrobiaceae bacterium]